MLLANSMIAVLLVLLLLVLAKGDSIPEGAQQNITTGTSSSPWLKNAANNFQPRRPGCSRMPWICRRGNHHDTEKPPHDPERAQMWCCGNQCVDTNSDINNCGGCRRRCSFHNQCCRGFCVDTNNDPFNCGGCATKCHWRVECVYGMCGYGEQPTPPQPFPPRPPRPHPPHPFPPQPPRPWPPHPSNGDESSAMSESS